MNTFVIGDIHGSYKALLQCLERSGFNKEEDTLITLGDIVDSFKEVGQIKETVNELLTIPNRIDIRGNHDEWFLEFIEFSVAHDVWTSQGGDITLKSYNAYEEPIPEDHKEFFRKQNYYYIDDNNRLFVHGGYNYKKPFNQSTMEELIWDRHLFNVACQWENFTLIHPTEPKNYFKEFKEIFIGHTNTLSVGWRMLPDHKPLHLCNLWNLDTGGGGYGKLTIMNVDTKQYWQSDLIEELYPK